MKNPNYKKATYKDSNDQWHKFVRSHEQDCSKCSRANRCTGYANDKKFCCFALDPDNDVVMGVGNYILKPRKERKRFKILLDALKVGDEVKIGDIIYTIERFTSPARFKVVWVVDSFTKDDITDIRDIYGVWQERWK